MFSNINKKLEMFKGGMKESTKTAVLLFFFSCPRGSFFVHTWVPSSVGPAALEH